MKKLVAMSLVLLFAASMAASAMAFGDCEGKAQKTKVTDTTKGSKDKS